VPIADILVKESCFALREAESTALDVDDQAVPSSAIDRRKC
jgi:hypothetical protein